MIWVTCVNYENVNYVNYENVNYVNYENVNYVNYENVNYLNYKNVNYVNYENYNNSAHCKFHWLGDGRSGDRIPVVARISAPAQTGPGAHPASCTIGIGSFPGVERPGRDADPSPSSSAVSHERVELYLYSPYGPYGLYRASVHFTLTVNVRDQFRDQQSVGDRTVTSLSRTIFCSTENLFNLPVAGHKQLVILHTGLICGIFNRNCNMRFNLLKMERRPLYLKTQSVPRCKHFSYRL